MDAMSVAIEDSAVMLYGVSLAYKESANVRTPADCAILAPASGYSTALVHAL